MSDQSNSKVDDEAKSLVDEVFIDLDSSDVSDIQNVTRQAGVSHTQAEEVSANLDGLNVGTSTDFDHLNDLDMPEDSAERNESQVPSQQNNMFKVWVVCAVLGIAAALSGLIFVGTKVLARPHATQSPLMEQVSQVSNIDPRMAASTASTHEISNALITPKTSTQTEQPPATTATVPPFEQTIQPSKHEVTDSIADQGRAAASIDVTEDRSSEVGSGGESSTGDLVTVQNGSQVMTSAQGEAVTLTGTPVSDEENLYDKMLENMPGKEIPSEAIKIDQNVIKRHLAGDHMAVLDREVASAKSSVVEVSNSVQGIRVKLEDFSKAFEKNLQTQSATSKQVEQLTVLVRESNQAHEQQMKDLRASFDASITKAIQKNQALLTTVSDAKQTKVNVASAEAVKPTRQQPAVKQAVKDVAVKPQFIAQVKPAVVTAKNVVPEASSGKTCRVSTVSAIWRVKGVNGTSAYVVRVQDNEGLFVREGSDIPGFGTVKSFDSSTRTVCTSSGMIGR